MSLASSTPVLRGRSSEGATSASFFVFANGSSVPAPLSYAWISETGYEGSVSVDCSSFAVYTGSLDYDYYCHVDVSSVGGASWPYGSDSLVRLRLLAASVEIAVCDVTLADSFNFFTFGFSGRYFFRFDSDFVFMPGSFPVGWYNFTYDSFTGLYYVLVCRQVGSLFSVSLSSTRSFLSYEEVFVFPDFSFVFSSLCLLAKGGLFLFSCRLSSSSELSKFFVLNLDTKSCDVYEYSFLINSLFGVRVMSEWRYYLVVEEGFYYFGFDILYSFPRPMFVDRVVVYDHYAVFVSPFRDFYLSFDLLLGFFREYVFPDFYACSVVVVNSTRLVFLSDDLDGVYITDSLGGDFRFVSVSPFYFGDYYLFCFSGVLVAFANDFDFDFWEGVLYSRDFGESWHYVSLGDVDLARPVLFLNSE
jgi:hypothetical protein